MKESIPVSNPPRRTRTRDIVRAVLLVLLGLFLLDCLNFLGPDLIARHRLLRYEKQCEAKGEKFDFTNFIPRPVPDALNFAFTPVVASSYEGILDKNGNVIEPHNTNVVNRLDMTIFAPLDKEGKTGNWALGQKADLKAFQSYYRALAAQPNKPPGAAQLDSPAADVLAGLGKYDQTIEDLRQAAALPDSRFPSDYDCEPPDAMLMPHLRPIKNCSHVLELRAVAELHNGQSDKSLADIKLMFRLMASIRSEPVMVSQLYRIDILKLALQPVWEGTQEHLWSDAQLRELDEDLSGLDFLADFESAVRSERSFQLKTMEYLRRTREAGMVGEDVIPTLSEIRLRFSPDSVYYDNELALARTCQEWLLPIANPERHCVSLEAIRSASANIDQMREDWTYNNVLAALLLPSYETCAQRYSYAQSCVDMARIGCALERYRLTERQYPESLNALAPRYMKSVPSDIVNRQPLIYRRADNGGDVLYSVGLNGKDDGGTVYVQAHSKTEIDYVDGDWVWSGLP